MLALVALTISVPLGVTLGILAGLNEHKPIDNTVSVGSLSVVGLPEFVTGLVLIQVFSFGLDGHSKNPFWFMALSALSYALERRFLFVKISGLLKIIGNPEQHFLIEMFSHQLETDGQPL